MNFGLESLLFFGIWTVMQSPIDSVSANKNTNRKKAIRVNIGFVIGKAPRLEMYLRQSLNKTDTTLDVRLVPLKLNPETEMYDRIIQAHSDIDAEDVHAVIGPFDTAVAMASEKINVPYLVTSSTSDDRYSTVFHMVPKMTHFTQAFVDLIKFYKWKKIGVFYDNEFGVSLLENLMTYHDLTLKTWKISPGARYQNIRDFLIQMRKFWIQKIILFCTKDSNKRIMETARSLAMITTPYEWAFFDPEGEYWEAFSIFEDVQTNFTVLSLTEFKKSDDTSLAGLPQKMTEALVSDSLIPVIAAQDAIRKGYKASKSSGEVNLFLRETITDSVRRINADGMTGQLQFDQSRMRKNVSLHLSQISDGIPEEIGQWNSDILFNGSNLNLGRRKANNVSIPFPLKGRRVDVVMIEERPFTMKKRDYMSRSDNDRYEGFAVDLLAEIAKMLEFQYNIYIVNDGKFGSKIAGEWNGIVGELLTGNATMSVAPLSINSDREEAIDFTKPFMTRYISVLVATPVAETSYFEFLTPLSIWVWLCTFGAFVGVSVVLYLLEKMGTSNNKEAQQISFRESFWFIFGSLLQGNTDSSPSTVPGRILTSSWWFFALILISSYTANLAAFLTVKKINTPIQSVTELAQQSKIKYGTVQDSGVMSFFKNTKVEHFAKMWAQMSEVDPHVMVKNTVQGYAKVKKGNYAFFWDTTVNKYKTTEDCSYTEIGPPFDAKGFGIGVPPGATYREDLSMAILKLSDTGKLYEMENNYWGVRNCPDEFEAATEETSELQIENVAGVFFILVGGIILSAIFGVIEKFLSIFKGSLKSDRKDEKAKESFL